MSTTLGSHMRTRVIFMVAVCVLNWILGILLNRIKKISPNIHHLIGKYKKTLFFTNDVKLLIDF